MSPTKAAVAEGELEQAVIGCRILSSEYLSDGAFAMDHAAVLRLLAKASTTVLIAFELLNCCRVPDECFVSKFKIE